MTRRTTLAGAGLAALAASAIAIGPATAATTPKITIKGGTVFKPGVSVTDNQRFVGTTTAKPGATIKVVNRAKTQDPHTISVVKRSDMPKSFAAFEKIVGPFMAAHQASEGPEPPKVPLVDVGSPGFGAAGDSLFFVGKSAEITLSSDVKKGSTLNYLCLIHPWMQGKIKVN